MKKNFPKLAVWLCLCLPCISVWCKNVLLQGYVVGNNSYILNLWQGFLRLLPYLPLQVATIALVFCFGFLFRERGRYIYGTVLNAVFSIIAIIDIAYFRAYNVMPAAIMLPVAGSQGASGVILDTLPTLFVWTDILFLLDFAVWGVLYWFISRRGWRTLYNPSYRPRLTGITATVSAFALAVIPLLSVVGWDGGLYRKLYVASDTIQKSLYFSFVGFHGEDIAQTTMGKVTTAEMTEEDEALRDAYFDWKLQDSSDNAFLGQAEGKNVLIIQVESLESFVIGQYLNGQEITPHINSLANGGYYFSNIHEQVKCGNSSDCDFMVMTSLLPANKSYVFGSYSQNQYLTLPKLLKQNGGYHSAYFHGAADSTWNYQDMLSDTLGVDAVHMDYTKDEILNGYLSDKSFVRQTLQKIDDSPLNTPFYAHVVTCSSHIPFHVPEEYHGLQLQGELAQNPLGKYLQAIHYVDEQIGTLLQGLEQRGVLENTLIAVLGDHGGVHKYYPHYVSQLSDDAVEPWFPKEQEYTLPLIFYSNDMESPQRFDVVGGQIDILPSLLYLLGIPKEQYETTLLGRNLFSTSRSFCMRDDGKLYGSLSEEDYAVAQTMYYLSDILIRSNQTYPEK